MPPSTDLLQGTLDMLILKTLAPGQEHGWAIAQRIQQMSNNMLQIGQGSLYPALHRLEYAAGSGDVGRIGEQSARAVLCVDRRRAETAWSGIGELGSADGRCKPGAAGCVACRIWWENYVE